MKYWENSVTLLAIRDISKHYQQESLISNPVGLEYLNNKETRHLNRLLGIHKKNSKGGGNPKKQKL